jgi:alanine racemase
MGDERRVANGRPTVAWIDAAALRANAAALRARLAPGVRLLAVVKADGYGHGATLVAPLLAAAGADLFGVATVAEGVELRAAGITQPIVVLTGATEDELNAALESRLSVAVIDTEMVRAFAARLGTRRLPVHLKLDTGMGRLGVARDQWPAFLAAVRAAPQLRVEGVFSHFADAENAHSAFCDAQLASFRDGVAQVRAAGLDPGCRHLANSAAALLRPDTHFDAVRPGIALYGIAPAPSAAVVPLRSVMQLCTRIWQLKQVPAGSSLSYGQAFTTRRASRIAVLPIGYADGYARGLSNRGAVLVRGQRAPIVGRVCMDLTLVDVTDIPGAATGDEVVLWGRQAGTELSVTEVATWLDTIPYELLTRVGRRVPRRVRRASG